MNRSITYEKYKQTVLAGWLGKCLGGVIGAPLENHKQYHNYTVDNVWPDEIGANDDLDIQMVWLEAMEDFGVHLSSDDMVKIWQERCFYNYLDYGYFLYNVQRGIAPGLSGTWNNRFFAESEGCPIRSEIWGLVSPGNMHLAADLAKLDGQLDHGGISVEIEMLQAAVTAESFFCDDLMELFKRAQEVLPVESKLPGIIRRVKQISDEYPEHRQAWQVIIREYGHRDASKAISNFAIVLLALFKGKGNFQKTILYCVNSGWDVDCTAATAGAFCGTIYGYDSLPADWTCRLNDRLICAIKRRFDNVLLTDLAEATCKVGVEMAIERNKEVTFIGAPEVFYRSAPEAKASIQVEYLDDPVLWDRKTTTVNFIIKNPHESKIAGSLKLETPDDVIFTLSEQDIEILPKSEIAVSVELCRTSDSTWLADKNLFKVEFDYQTGHAEKVFGLGGARQWQVYGPYWEMWDRTKYNDCPFHNDNLKCHPGQAGCGSDSYNNYVRLDYEYLDEKLLLEQDISAEVPLLLEASEDWITEKHIGGFSGQACYYFVRTFKNPSELKEMILSIGRTGPYRVWLDGKLIGESLESKAWTPWEQENVIPVKFNKSTAHRLIVKFIRDHENMTFSTHFMGAGDPERKRGISWLYDSFADLPVSSKSGLDNTQNNFFENTEVSKVATLSI